MAENKIERRQALQAALQAFDYAPLAQASANLLNSLGYASEKTADLGNNAEAFLGNIEQFKPELGKISRDKVKADRWKSCAFLFQLTNDEIPSLAVGQTPLGADTKVARSQIESYVFLAIDLQDEQWSRTDLASITRELNKRFPMPSILLFRHGSLFSLAVIDRRQNLRDGNRDVIDSRITVIKDVRLAKPHRAHLDILASLALENLGAKRRPSNFRELYDAWIEALSTQALNKRFYQELANWYFWALTQVCFPTHAPKDADGRDSISVIRLITRVIFCWFLKEKGLLPDALFDPGKIQTLLNDPSPEKSTYYQAILQNLFFATLNQEMGKREFRKNGQNLMAHNLYRYRRLLKNPDEVLNLFASIPFMNGGLFECLDKTLGTKETPDYIRIDGFSDRDDNPLKIPNALFFGAERVVDLSEAYGDKKFKSAKVAGLIHILDRYKFTVAENTPIEEEVALDPELLGKVFENLLAAYNPETGATARKQTGSFYTPREIVNYMVDESLIASLKTKLETACPGAANTEERLRHLFAYNDQPHQFAPAEVDALIEAIDHLNILDPACGSGAFPMGILHKLVFVLGKLDPGNQSWKARQLAKAAEIPDATVRERVLADIEQTFGANELDYGRKLYLIENCIYGVDIQPIAVQITKLRFFISLVVDQKMNHLSENLGIRPLPNLETKFVAANTLIGIARPGQQLLRNPDIGVKEAELRKVREEHFLAKTPAKKRKCREQDAELRVEIAELLKSDGWDIATSRKLAAWDPYDQNAYADFFDAEWMFGLTMGFDVVIGNPPYLNVELVSAEQKIYFSEHYKTFYKRYDVFGIFFECSLLQLVKTGVVAFIVPAQIFNNLSYKKLRSLILSNCWLREVLYLGDKIFTAANNDVCVLFLDTGGNSSIRLVDALDFEHPKVTNVPATHFEKFGGVISVSSSAGADSIASKVFRPGAERLRERFEVFQGIVTGNNPVFLPEPEQIEAAKLEKALLHTILLGRDIEKWRIHTVSRRILYVNGDTDLKKFPNSEKWLLPHRSALNTRRECQNGVIPWYSLQWPRDTRLLDARPKILVQRTRNPRLKTRIVAALDTEGYYAMESVIILAPKRSNVPTLPMLGILNSSLINYIFLTRFLNVSVKGEYLKDLPLPSFTAKQTMEFGMLVDHILKAKRANGAADTSALERKINQYVYVLYDLTPDEIRIVEESIPTSNRRAQPVPEI